MRDRTQKSRVYTNGGVEGQLSLNELKGHSWGEYIQDKKIQFVEKENNNLEQGSDVPLVMHGRYHISPPSSWNDPG